MTIRLAGTILLAVAALSATSWAQNPRISLKLENVTGREAAERLSQAAGLTVDLPRRQVAPDDDRRSSDPLEERASFDWTSTTFGGALHQLCERYGLSPRWRPGGYTLCGASRERSPIRPIGLVEKRGFRLFLRGVSVSEDTSVDFTRPGADHGRSDLHLDFGCEIIQGDAEMVTGVWNVTARDNLGTLLLSDPGPAAYPMGSPLYPDEWGGRLRLSAPHPAATRLDWLEADLVGCGLKSLRVEMPLPLTERAVRRQIGDVTLVASGYQASSSAEVVGFQVGPPGAPPASGPQVRVRVYAPATSAISYRNLRGRGSWAPYAVGVSGRTYPAVPLPGSGGWSTPDVRVYDATLLYPMEELPARLVWDLVEKDPAGPDVLLTFRMTDIPLPAESMRVTSHTEPGPAAARDPDPQARAYFARGGGMLTGRVEIGSAPAGSGWLAFGLTLHGGANTGISWVDLQLRPDGTARLEDLQPGRYRVLQLYRPEPGTALVNLRTGRWLNGESVVAVAAGEQVRLPPLRWVPRRGPTPPRPPRRAVFDVARRGLDH